MRTASARRWGPLVAAVAALALFWACDRWAQNRAPVAGYCPETSTAVAFAPDGRTLWRAAVRSPEWDAITGEIAAPLRRPLLWVRKRAGLRPTPDRMRLWLGDRVLAADAPQGRGFCFYPGLLLRTAAVLRLPGVPAYTPGPQRLGGLHVAWRDGYLVVGTSAAYVEASLTAPPHEPALLAGPEEVALSWREAPRVDAVVAAAAGWPVRGRLDLALTDGESPLMLLHGDQPAPVIRAAGRSPMDLLPLGLSLYGRLRSVPLMAETADALERGAARWRLPPLEPRWWDRIQTWSLVVDPPRWLEGYPAADLAVAMEPSPGEPGRHPFTRWVAALPAVPTAWDRVPGYQAPVLGAPLTVCTATASDAWLAAGTEPAMARAVGRWSARERVHADLVLRIAWGPLAGTAAEGLREARAGGPWTGFRNGVDDERLQRRLRALGRLGELRIDGHAAGGQVAFSGHLAGALDG